MQLLFPGKRRGGPVASNPRSRAAGCQESQGTPALGREVVSLDHTTPGSPRTIGLEEKGPCFVHHPAKNRDLHWGNTLPPVHDEIHTEGSVFVSG